METNEFLFVLAAAWTFLVSVLWLVIGWRAMRAHERIAANIYEIRLAIRSYFQSR